VSVVVVGLHERDVPLELLERLAIGDDELAKALRELCDSPNLDEAVVVSTCMRTEVYAVVERFHDGLADIEAFFARRVEAAGGDLELLDDQLSVAYEEAAVRHLFEVSAGIDSAVLGEGEILRQVRHAADRARAEHTLGPVLDPLFRHGLEAGKRARAETGISRGVTSLAHVALSAARESLGGDLTGRRVVLLGAGEMASGIVAALADLDEPTELVIANRTLQRAKPLADTLGGRAVALGALEEELAAADVVFGASAAERPLVERGAIVAAMAGRPDRALVIIDTALPRDVEPSVGQVQNVTLRDIDDLRLLAEAAMDSRRLEVPRVNSLLDEELERFRESVRSRTAAPLVAALRQHAERVRSAELDRVAARLERLDPEGRELIELVTRRIVAKLVHEPTVQVKEAAGSPRGERLAEALRALYGL
jgi:glutamyl-tRNA reductase